MHGVICNAALIKNAPHLYVYLEDDTISIIEMSDITNFRKGDIVFGNLDIHGFDEFKNQTQDFQFTGYIQEVNAAPSKRARQFQIVLNDYLAQAL